MTIDTLPAPASEGDRLRPAPGRAALPVAILGTGLSLPGRVVTNDELVAGLDTSDAWIRERTGITQRRFLEEGRTTSDLCLDAARQALAASGLAAADLDAIVLATATPDQPLPSTALIVKEQLGAERAIPIDLNQAACAGGVLGLLLGSHLLNSGHLKAVLVIGAEALSRITNPDDRTTRVFFGDAAGAVILGPSADPTCGVLSWDVGSWLSRGVEIRSGGASRANTPETLAAGDQYLRMDGRTVWDTATTQLPKSIVQTVADAGLGLHDIDYFVVHQANRRLIDEVLLRLGVDADRAGITVDKLGNTGSASIYTVLHAAVTGNRISSGDLVVISGIGAGFIWGSLCLRYA